MPETFRGDVKARVVHVRFALSGKIASVSKHTGDTVKKWGLIASLDRKVLQMELDRELADFEKVRADFEIFNQKNPDPKEMIDKYLKMEKQASLNASVKAVELVKARLDQADLFSPVDGLIMDDSNIVPGLYITPAGAAVKIIDISSYCFEIEIKQKEIPVFEKSQKTKIKLEGIKKEIAGNSSPVYSDGKAFFIKIPITDSQGILPGLTGSATIPD